MFGTQPTEVNKATQDLIADLKYFEDTMVEMLDKSAEFAKNNDLEAQQTCLIAATSYGTAALVTRAKLDATKTEIGV